VRRFYRRRIAEHERKWPDWRPLPIWEEWEDFPDEGYETESTVAW